MADSSHQQQSRQHAYPSPHSYPSPTSMNPSYAYPPPPGNEPFRGSPQGGPNMSLPPLNLPPIRLQDGQGQHGLSQPPSAHPPQHAMPQMPQYYPVPHASPGQPMNMGSAQHLALRYQLPPAPGEQRVLSGGRHKKEIKRRTKTGCLTCRKRRIKCDEAHPMCRNCQKSKRECLGYDPIFKPQPGTPQLQPAPNSAPHPASAPAPAPPTSAPYGTQVPQGYAPAGSTGYAPPIPASGSSHSSHENFNSAIDPALAAADSAMNGGQPPYNGVHGLNPGLRGVGSASPYSSTASDAQPAKAKRLKVSDIFAIANHTPPEVPARNAPIPPELDDEFANIFLKDYVNGLDAVLETRWFSTNKNALTRILDNPILHEEAAHFTETVKHKNNSADMAGVFSQEARLIWHLLGVCKQPGPTSNGTNGTLPASAENGDFLLKEVRARFDILEALLTYQTLDHNPLRQISYPAEYADMKRPELDFWDNLGTFLIHADTESAPPGAADYHLSTMRSVLHEHEVRDAIYSFAIARYIGNRFRGFPITLPNSSDPNPENDLTKLHVAMQFISHECRSGSQQVIARICDMAMLSWQVSRAP
ncbi:hypothetical protein BDV95DRAFT_608757 [Massariosphaeria phaeospora]|uniref:Zn(2)-C6 fungal-type domain-containing protein n=1 Tax=Massariosphaeria phaeospora TaxID=100035 RepID=A0A7C8M819_9PLEO|nr:hypothetical protein BDV95DRAFT_608757 [Massariosphaeria phaeospora]